MFKTSHDFMSFLDQLVIWLRAVIYQDKFMAVLLVLVFTANVVFWIADYS